MADSHQRYLEAMGIQLWKQRRPLPPAAASIRSAEAPSEYAETAMMVDAMEATAGQDSALPPAADRAGRIARMDWEEMQSTVSTCTACGLHASRTQTVFGVGDPQARWLIIGEAPGADEDRQGEPFVGRAGKLLDAMLFALGLERGEVFIANVLKCRPPNNRDPLPEEVRCCWPFLGRQIALIQPRIILAVGRIAAQTLLQADTPMSRLRGRVYQLAGVPLVVTYHPAYLLRSPREKRKAWEDLLLARRTLRENGASQPPSASP